MAHNTTASTSASNSSAPYSAPNYFHIFINHRGCDVKKTFAGYLYRRLTNSHGMRVFLDRPELKAGKRILSQIKQAIEVASVQIAIFSENYANSKWCLDELRLMVDSGATILPVFYNIKPSDLRWADAAQDGPYARALLKHEEKGRYDSLRIQGWRDALSHVANISGFELEACNGEEADLLEKVVERVLTKVPKPALRVAKYATGLGEKLEDFEKTVSPQQEQQPMESKVVAIAGVGGVGKTTLAKEFFNSKRSGYGCSSFLADVREKASRASLPSLQSQLIKDLKGISRGIDNWEEGIEILQTYLSSCQALIVIDDVDDADQLDAFLPIKGVLHPRSLILVTSRDKHVLRSAGIRKSSIYHLKGLNPSHSQELFCSYAFFQPHPRPGFENLVDRFVKSCDGLPLSLKVFGALLCGQDQHYWEEKLNELHRLPDKILARLKISYNSLNQEEQQIFLDIACFAIGEDRDKWVRIWGGFTGLQTLEDRCLVEVEVKEDARWMMPSLKVKRMRMHDHVRDMGRNIAEEVSMPRRLWRSVEEVHDLFEEQSLSSAIPDVRGIKMPRLRTSTIAEEAGDQNFLSLNKISSEPAIKIRALQLLQSTGEFVESIIKRVRSPNLVWLRWNNCPCSSLPTWIPMDQLKVLEVSGTKLKKLWRRDSQAPLQLRELHVHDAPLLEFPKSIGKLTHLEKIVLNYLSRPGPADLLTLAEEFFHLRSLKYLELHGRFKILPKEFRNLTNLQSIVLSGCQRIENLPDSFTDLTNLRVLRLFDCNSLKRLPKSLGDLTNLQVIQLSDCNSLKRLPKSLGDLTNLQRISLYRCGSLELLPKSFANLANLQDFYLSGCNRLKRLPNSFGDLTNLQRITLNDCEGLEVLPESFGCLTNLLRIELTGCKRLTKLPESFTGLTNLQKLNLSGSDSLKRLPNSMGDLTNLQEISLSSRGRLKRLPRSLGSLTNLQQIRLSGCGRLKRLPNSLGDLRNLQEITLENCEGLEVLPESFGCLTNLLSIELTGCKRLKKLLDSFTGLRSLQHLKLSGSDRLKRLPRSLGSLTNLQEISLSSCGRLKRLPNSLGDLTNLQRIAFRNCEGLEVLPESFGYLTNLLRIGLTGCKRLKKLPESFTGLTNLQNLNLSGSDSLKRLPNSMGDLTNLQEIILSSCGKLKRLPNSLGDLRNLKGITLNNCEGLEVLPESLGCLTNLLRIELTGCKRLKNLPDSFTGLANLQHLQLSDSDRLKRLPKSLGCLTNLQHINLSNCKSLKKLPNSLGDLTNLQDIRLDKCESLEVLPDSFRHLTNLVSMDLEACRSLKMLPNNLFGNLTNLKRVGLSSCESLKKLPKSLGELTNLRGIDLSGCKSLKKLPSLLGNLWQLRYLDLSHCSTCSLALPENITTLQILNFSGCIQMEVLPAQVEHQKSLVWLNLVGTNLKELTINAQTACLSNLKYLFLGSPLLKELPPSFGCLSSLKVLLLHGCQELKRLPDSFALLTQLTELEISKCGIQELPDLMEMNNLRTLRVLDCPLRELPFKEESAPRRKRKRRATEKGLIRLERLELYCTEVREVCFPEGINLYTLRIMCCNDLVKVGSLPATVEYLTLRSCGALGKVEGLSGLAEPRKVDLRGCCNIEMGEVPHFGNTTRLFIPTDTYNPQEKEEEWVEKEMAALQEGVLPNRFAWRLDLMKESLKY